jgi:hypothetical protein
MADDFEEIDFDESEADFGDFDYDAQEEFEDVAEGQAQADVGSARRYSPPGGHPGILDAALTVAYMVGNIAENDDYEGAAQIASAADYFEFLTRWAEPNGHGNARDGRRSSQAERKQRMQRSFSNYRNEASRAISPVRAAINEWRANAMREFQPGRLFNERGPLERRLGESRDEHIKRLRERGKRAYGVAKEEAQHKMYKEIAKRWLIDQLKPGPKLPGGKRIR